MNSVPYTGTLSSDQDPWQPADMVLVAVGENDGAHVLAVLEQVAEIGDDDVDAEQFGFGEHQPGVDDDDVVAPANGHAIHAEFAEPAERNNLELTDGHLQVSMLAQGKR